ncbi:hypothetical protein M3484_15225 [Pseudomonas sp. GX19020]|uniref:hypothetical protein n=1 Tax=Pseudomonas sp. GX19020 TaxID=2942277 RepID=UPI002019D847|nr:hypothetical protein [Pseudomonas sp. GX19020]MCL4067926.1 hypothetical protein [Pseudomonas sp. GX19020]
MKTSRRIWLLILMVVIGIAPLASVALAGLIADWNGCALHEGFAQPCILLGTDIGGVLYTMAVMGWLMLISLFFLGGGLLGLAWEGVLLIARRMSGRLR